MTPEEISYYLLQAGHITLSEHLKSQELPFETINELRKAIEEYETNRK